MSELSDARYVSLATFRKSGAEVATPVWWASENGNFYVFSAGDAGKVKRLRNSNRARVARCDGRGKLLGEWFDATAELIVSDAESDRALTALRGKYGIQMWIADVVAKLTRRFHRRAYIRVRLNP